MYIVIYVEKKKGQKKTILFIWKIPDLRSSTQILTW